VAAKTAAKKVAPEVEGSDVASEPETFTWEPKSGGEPIVLPSAAAAVPRGKTLAFFYQMNKRKGNFVDQAMFALTSAGVPETVQDRIFIELDDEESLELVNAWASEIAGATPGES